MPYFKWKIIVFMILTLHSIGRIKTENVIDSQLSSTTSQKVENDNVAANDEHHKVVILVPQVVKPMATPHHGKHIPVVHTGKVIHAHHHDGKVSHVHSHLGKANHNHKHNAVAGHKHTHHGVGIHKHNHLAKGTHSHKHIGHNDHAHKHFGKASISHKHVGHGTHDHKHYGHGLHNHHHVGHKGGKYTAEYGSGLPYVNIGSKTIKIVHPGSSLYSTGGDLLSGITTAEKGTSGKLIQIRIPDEHDANLIKEINIDTDTDIAVMKSKYITPDDEYESVNLGSIGSDYFSNFEDDESGIFDHSSDGTADNGYRFGEGYRLAAAAAEAALHDDQDDNNAAKYPFVDDDKGGFVPMIPRNNAPAGIGTYSDAYHYQY